MTAPRDLVAEARTMAEDLRQDFRPPIPDFLAKLADEVERLRAQLTAREITDPDELPPGSIVVRDGVAWQLEGEWWSMRGTRTRWDKPHGTGPIILLYVPTEEARDGE